MSIDRIENPDRTAAALRWTAAAIVVIAIHAGIGFWLLTRAINRWEPPDGVPGITIDLEPILAVHAAAEPQAAATSGAAHERRSATALDPEPKPQSAEKQPEPDVLAKAVEPAPVMPEPSAPDPKSELPVKKPMESIIPQPDALAKAVEPAPVMPAPSAPDPKPELPVEKPAEAAIPQPDALAKALEPAPVAPAPSQPDSKSALPPPVAKPLKAVSPQSDESAKAVEPVPAKPQPEVSRTTAPLAPEQSHADPKPQRSPVAKGPEPAKPAREALAKTVDPGPSVRKLQLPDAKPEGKPAARQPEPAARPEHKPEPKSKVSTPKPSARSLEPTKPIPPPIKPPAKTIVPPVRPAQRPVVKRAKPANVPQKPDRRQPPRKTAEQDEQQPLAPETRAHGTAARADRTRQGGGPSARTVAASGASSGQSIATWRGEVMAHLNAFKPSSPNGGSGTARVAFRVDRAGRVVTAGIAQSSGDPALDQAALAMVRQASPLPAPPPELGGRISLSVPVRFR